MIESKDAIVSVLGFTGVPGRVGGWPHMVVPYEGCSAGFQYTHATARGVARLHYSSPCNDTTQCNIKYRIHIVLLTCQTSAPKNGSSVVLLAGRRIIRRSSALLFGRPMIDRERRDLTDRAP